MNGGERIALVSAMTRSLPPVRAALAEHWPQADVVSLIDEALETDRARGETRSQPFGQRLAALAGYATANGASAILFTCSAFAAEIGQLKTSLPVPALRPDEAVYLAAARTGQPVGVLLTFPPAEAAARTLIAEMGQMDERVKDFAVRVIPGAFEAAQAGNMGLHDWLIDDAIRHAPEPVVLMGQYSMTAVGKAASGHGKTVMTGPEQAVLALRTMLETGR